MEIEQSKLKTISLVIPVYNGDATIEALSDRLFENLRSNYCIQLVLINDGSKDLSSEACTRIYQKYPNQVTFLNLKKNFGEHNAVLAGLRYAYGHYAVILDDDFQNPPSEVEKLVNKAFEGNYDVVYSTYEKKEHSLLRNLGSHFNNLVASFMLQKPLSLYLCSFKAISLSTIQDIITYQGPHPYIDGLILRVTRNIGVQKVLHDKREIGRSNYTITKLIGLWLNMFVNFSILPLRLFSYLGFLFSIASFLFGCFVIYQKLRHPAISQGWSSLMTAIMFFSSIQLIFLGLIGEYLARILLLNNGTPAYVIRDKYGVRQSPQ